MLVNGFNGRQFIRLTTNWEIAIGGHQEVATESYLAEKQKKLSIWK